MPFPVSLLYCRRFERMKGQLEIIRGSVEMYVIVTLWYSGQKDVWGKRTRTAEIKWNDHLITVKQMLTSGLSTVHYLVKTITQSVSQTKNWNLPNKIKRSSRRSKGPLLCPPHVMGFSSSRGEKSKLLPNPVSILCWAHCALSSPQHRCAATAGIPRNFPLHWNVTLHNLMD